MSLPPLTEDFPCAYFDDGRTASIEYRIIGEEEAGEFDTFLGLGYRRLGRVLYRNVCRDCSACVPVRVRVERFMPGRSQKRTLRMNRDIRIEVAGRPAITKEKIGLYSGYLRSKHSEARDEESSISHLMSMHFGFPSTIEMDYFIGNRLIGVGIVDEGRDSLSANYFYYDTDFLERRPGVFSILSEISLAGSFGKSCYYLGFYIEDNPKMAYKKFFRPNEAFSDGKWRPFMA